MILSTLLKIWFLCGVVLVTWALIKVQTEDGKKFLNSIEELARESGFKEITLEVILVILLFVFGILILPYTLFVGLLKFIKKEK